MLKARNIPATLPVTKIRPPERWVHLNLPEIWEYRDLLFWFVWQEIKARYKQTIIGGAWAILQPFVTMVVFSILFGRLIRVPTDGIPYPIFAYSALVPWTYFTHALNKSSNCLVQRSQIITKVYFPRLILPISSVLSAFVDFIVAFLMLIGLMLYFDMTPTWAIITLPFFLLLVIATALGVGLWLAALNVQFRDVANILPFLMQVWLFATPVAYPSSLIPERWSLLYGLNPMTGVIEGFRWALLGGERQAPGSMLWISVLAVLVVLVAGLYFFRRREDVFADVV